MCILYRGCPRLLTSTGAVLGPGSRRETSEGRRGAARPERGRQGEARQPSLIPAGPPLGADRGRPEAGNTRSGWREEAGRPDPDPAGPPPGADAGQPEPRRARRHARGGPRPLPAMTPTQWQAQDIQAGGSRVKGPDGSYSEPQAGYRAQPEPALWGESQRGPQEAWRALESTEGGKGGQTEVRLRSKHEGNL